MKSGACCVRWCGLRFACYHILTWGLGCQEHLFQSCFSFCLFVSQAIDFLLAAFLEQQTGFPSLCAAPSCLTSPPLLAQSVPMRADSSSCPTGIFVPALQPLHFSGRLYSMRLSSCFRQYTQCPGWKALSHTYLPSFAGQTGSISSPAFNLTWLHIITYVKALQSCRSLPSLLPAVNPRCHSLKYLSFQQWIYKSPFLFPDSDSALGK